MFNKSLLSSTNIRYLQMWFRNYLMMAVKAKTQVVKKVVETVTMAEARSASIKWSDILF